MSNRRVDVWDFDAVVHQYREKFLSSRRLQLNQAQLAARCAMRRTTYSAYFTRFNQRAGLEQVVRFAAGLALDGEDDALRVLAMLRAGYENPEAPLPDRLLLVMRKIIARNTLVDGVASWQDPHEEALSMWRSELFNALNAEAADSWPRPRVTTASNLIEALAEVLLTPPGTSARISEHLVRVWSNVQRCAAKTYVERAFLTTLCRLTIAELAAVEQGTVVAVIHARAAVHTILAKAVDMGAFTPSLADAEHHYILAATEAWSKSAECLQRLCELQAERHRRQADSAMRQTMEQIRRIFSDDRELLPILADLVWTVGVDGSRPRADAQVPGAETVKAWTVCRLADIVSRCLELDRGALDRHAHSLGPIDYYSVTETGALELVASSHAPGPFVGRRRQLVDRNALVSGAAVTLRVPIPIARATTNTVSNFKYDGQPEMALSSPVFAFSAATIGAEPAAAFYVAAKGWAPQYSVTDREVIEVFNAVFSGVAQVRDEDWQPVIPDAVWSVGDDRRRTGGANGPTELAAELQERFQAVQLSPTRSRDAREVIVVVTADPGLITGSDDIDAAVRELALGRARWWAAKAVSRTAGDHGRRVFRLDVGRGAGYAVILPTHGPSEWRELTSVAPSDRTWNVNLGIQSGEPVRRACTIAEFAVPWSTRSVTRSKTHQELTDAVESDLRLVRQVARHMSDLHLLVGLQRNGNYYGAMKVALSLYSELGPDCGIVAGDLVRLAIATGSFAEAARVASERLKHAEWDEGNRTRLVFAELARGRRIDIPLTESFARSAAAALQGGGSSGEDGLGAIVRYADSLLQPAVEPMVPGWIGDFALLLRGTIFADQKMPRVQRDHSLAELKRALGTLAISAPRVALELFVLLVVVERIVDR